MINIRKRREELGITAKFIAEKCGISQQTLCDYEKGRCKPSIDVAIKLAEALGVSDIKFFMK